MANLDKNLENKIGEIMLVAIEVSGLNYAQFMSMVHKTMREKAIAKFKGNKCKAAKYLKLHRNRLSAGELSRLGRA